jgi:hypothetical protein
MRKAPFLIGLLAIFVLIGCGVSDKLISESQQRIDALKEKGVPDSSLSEAIVYLYAARDAKKRGNTGLANKSADSMQVLIAKAEDQYTKDMKRLRPYVDSMRQELQKGKEALSGLHEKRLDSMIAVVDSFARINWLLQAEAKVNETMDLLPRLKFDQKRAAELRTRIPGAWTCTNVTKHSQDNTVHAVEKKVFTFNKDGSPTFVEKKSGKSSPFLKEDWEFRSYGTYDLLGDTIHLFVDRFASVKQNFTELHNRDGKKVWEEKPGPQYDSSITDGSQNRYITYHNLKLDFERN